MFLNETKAHGRLRWRKKRGGFLRPDGRKSENTQKVWPTAAASAAAAVLPPDSLLPAHLFIHLFPVIPVIPVIPVV